MQDRLKVDIGRIQSAADDVQTLHDRFANANQYLDGYRDALGHKGLADAMDSFSGDWKIHRDQLANRLQKLATDSQDAVDAYTGADSDLAKAISQKSPGSGS
jgi:hypothetical protein